MRTTIFNARPLRPVLKGIGGLFLRIMGWRLEGAAPRIGKYVMVCAPHTTNWDGVFLIAFAFVFGLDLRWLGKKSLLKFPFKNALLWLGMIPVDRSQKTNLVQQMIEEFKKSDSLVLAIPPEGTRKQVGEWKTGFYHIAAGAKVPVVLGFIDFANKRLGIGGVFHPTGDAESDIPQIQNFYRDIKGKNNQTSLSQAPTAGSKKP